MVERTEGLVERIDELELFHASELPSSPIVRMSADDRSFWVHQRVYCAIQGHHLVRQGTKGTVIGFRHPGKGPGRDIIRVAFEGIGNAECMKPDEIRPILS